VQEVVGGIGRDARNARLIDSLRAISTTAFCCSASESNIVKLTVTNNAVEVIEEPRCR
jgi:hypothetical protein